MIDFSALTSYLRRVPSVDHAIRTGEEGGMWWCKFVLDIDHPLAWRVVQEFAHVLNYVSLEDRLPTVFKPVSPPPYMNGGPQQFLSWVIETTDTGFSPDKCVQWLEGRLPRPVDELSQWSMDDEET